MKMKEFEPKGVGAAPTSLDPLLRVVHIPKYLMLLLKRSDH